LNKKSTRKQCPCRFYNYISFYNCSLYCSSDFFILNFSNTCCKRVAFASTNGCQIVITVVVERRMTIIADNTIKPIQCPRSEEHTSELQSRFDLVCRLLLEKKKQITKR